MGAKRREKRSRVGWAVRGPGWVRGKYKSHEIYGSPSDPALKAEYEAYLEKRPAEIRAPFPQK